MKRVFQMASGVFAAVPGVATLWKGLAIPPDRNVLFAVAAEVTGIGAILILLANRTSLKKLRPNVVTRIAIVLAIAWFVSAILYMALLAWCVVDHPQFGVVYFPLWSSGELANVITRADGRHEAVDRYGLDPVVIAIQKMPWYALTITDAVLLLTYVSVFVTLTVGFGILGFHAEGPRRR